MTYSNDQVLQMAQEVGAEIFNNSDHYVVFSPEELTAFANAVRKQTLLEAAEVAAEELRRMAEEE